MNPMIWVIDDDASIRFVFDKALAANSITHRLFENGEAALEAIKHETPDVIVSDIRMPGIDGLELIKAVHDIDEKHSIYHHDCTLRSICCNRCLRRRFI